MKTFEYGDVTLPPDEVHDQARSYSTDEALLLIENAPLLEVENLLRVDGLSRAQVWGSARHRVGSRRFRCERAERPSGSGGG
jgi:hypothetical protein